MSYHGSQQQFGISDLQVLQQQLMLARLQELQKRQQIGQYGDVKSLNSVNNLSMLDKHAAGSQYLNLSGTLYNASGMGASSNLNWMHQNVSPSMQGINRDSSYSHGEGLMKNPSLQQPDRSIYGAPVTSGRINLGQYTPMQEVCYSSNEKLMPQMPELTNSFFDDKNSVSRSHAHSVDGPFMLRQDLQDQGPVGHASIHMLNSAHSSRNISQAKPLPKDISPPGYNKIGEQPVDTFFLRDRAKQMFDSKDTTTLDPLEEKILFDTDDSCSDISFTKLAALDTTGFVEASSGKDRINLSPCIQSGSWSALMHSAVAEASSSDTGIQEELSGLSFQNIESSVERQPSHIVFNEKQSTSDNPRAPVSSVDSMLSDCQQLPRVLVPAGPLMNNCIYPNDEDICQESRTSALSMSGNVYEFNQQAVNSHSFMPMNEYTVQKAYKSTSDDHKANGNPMAVDILYKKAAEVFGKRNHNREESSFDCYNSKLSQAYVAQAGHTCFNPEDSESSAICISSPGAISQQECFSQVKLTSPFQTETNPMIKGKQNYLADAYTKGSPASDMSASFDSQYMSPRDHGKQLQLFNASQTDSQKSQTWRIPSSFGHTLSPLQSQGASLSESCSGKSDIYGITASDTSNLKSEGNSLESYISDLQHVNNLVDGKTISISENVWKTFSEMSQCISLPGISPTQDAYHLKNANLFDHECTRSGVFSLSRSGTVKDLPSSVGLPSRSLAMGKDNSDEEHAPVIENVAVVEGHKPAENYFKISTNASTYSGSSNCSRVAQRSFSGGTLRVLPTCSQPQVSHNVENTKKELDIAYTDFSEMGSNSNALYNLGTQWVPGILGQKPVPRMYNLSKKPFGSQFNSVSSGDNSSNSTQLSPLQFMHSHKVPMLQNYSNGNVLYDRMRQLQMRAQIGPVGYVQNEYIKNQPMFALHDSAALASMKPHENEQLSKTATHVKEADASKNCEVLPGLPNQIVASEQSLPSFVPLSEGNAHLVLSTPKKRKAVYDCIPWYKKVMETHQGFHDISAAEEEWAEVTNRLMELVDGGERNVEMQPIFLAKRRLIVTTEITQLIFQPPPPSVLAVDAKIEYDIVIYSITKLALTDACGLANFTRIDCNMPHKLKNRDGGIANHLSNKTTELLKRTKELETHIERLSKGISVVDILIECQELEKFGMINHFAKYHSRVPESVHNVSACSTGMTSIRPSPQRYVTSVYVPAKLPEGVHCLSL